MEYDFSGWGEIFIDEEGNTLARDPTPGTYLGAFDPEFHVRLRQAINDGSVKATRVKSLDEVRNNPRF